MTFCEDTIGNHLLTAEGDESAKKILESIIVGELHEDQSIITFLTRMYHRLRNSGIYYPATTHKTLGQTLRGEGLTKDSGSALILSIGQAVKISSWLTLTEEGPYVFFDGRPNGDIFYEPQTTRITGWKKLRQHNPRIVLHQEARQYFLEQLQKTDYSENIIELPRRRLA